MGKEEELTEMSAVAYLKKRDELCGRHYDYCRGCPLYTEKNGISVPCSILEKEYPEVSVAIVEQWVKDHPEKRKTYAEDFLEKFPNSYTVKKTDENPYPLICRQVVYQGSRECSQIRAWYFSDDMCSNCWNEEMEENNG